VPLAFGADTVDDGWVTIWRRLLLGLRWWLGSTYVLGGVGCVIAGPIMIASGNWGGLYMVGGGAVMALTGWLLHPWGNRRRRLREAAQPAV
jgi:hypothetical protein